MSKHKSISKNVRMLLYEKYHHRCGYCGCELEYKDMQIDHIKSVYAHTDFRETMTEEEMYNESNLMPACRQCNLYKSTMDIESFRERLNTTLLNNLRNDFRYRLALKHGLIVETNKQIGFYFESKEVSE